MMQPMTKPFVLIFILNGVSPMAVKAADSTADASVAAPAAMAPASAASPANPTPRKPHHHRRKATSQVPTPSPAVPAAVAAPNPNPESSAGSVVVPGVTDKVGSRSVGDVNLGSQDHTPGTTGTSGQ